MKNQNEQTNMVRKGVDRRTIVKGAAWSVPVIAAAVAAPAHAASNPSTACGGCLAWDPTHQNLAQPPADTWITSPFYNGDSPATYGTALWAVYSLKYTCPIPSDVRYIQYLVTFDSHVQQNSNTRVSTSDGGSVLPNFTVAGTTPPAGVNVAAVAGVAFGPNSGASSASNVSALGSAVFYASNVPWSATPTDATSGPSLLHHITGASFTANVQLTTVYMDGTIAQTSCAVNMALQMVSPYPGYPADPTQSLHWVGGTLTAVAS